MKKMMQPNIRKVYGQAGGTTISSAITTNQEIQQINTAKKINSLLSSGAVSVTGPTQSRILKQKATGHILQPMSFNKPCYVCDEQSGPNGVSLTDAVTSVTNSKIPNKIGRVVGDQFMVIISADDIVCKRCMTMFNHMDRLEHDLDRVKSNILNLINKKYGITPDADATTTTMTTRLSTGGAPPAKLQRLNTGNTAISYGTPPINRKTSNGDDEDILVTRKLATRDPTESQLTTLFDSSAEKSTPVAIQQRQQTTITPIPGTSTTVTTVKKTQPTKIYKCMSCDFKTMDLKQFQPHYETCKQQSAGYRCKICKKLFTNMNALRTHTTEKHSNEFVCSICSINYLNEQAFKKHMETNHPDVKTIETTSGPVSGGALYSCNLCTYKTTDKQTHEDHLRKHIKVKPFKCRLCAMRFETREQASVHAKTHQPDYFKCGKCAMSFPQRELLMKHFETHKLSGGVQPQQQQQKQQQLQQEIQQQAQQQPIQQQQHAQQDLSTQKLLQATIDEALRDSGGGELDSKIHFLTCNICSLTFIQETYYNQHMETHKRGDGTKKATVPTSSSQSLIRQDVRNTNATILHTQTGSISDADIESMFEKMHSDKVETEGNSNSSENLVITSQESSGGGISFSITIPQQDDGNGQESQHAEGEEDPEQHENVGMTTCIDMPVLDQTDESDQQQHGQSTGAGGPVSMPSLDDDGDSSHPSNTEHIPMDLEEMQNAAESGQIKFILNEDGQILQLDNHIITTDADGNQILVQGTDSEQIQQLLQSVGVLQAGEGDGETFQMIQGENNQMIIVQGDNNGAQLIDASMLNEDGHLVIQQQDGDEEMHVVNEEGVQVPVSIAFASAGDEHQEHQQQHGDESQDEQQLDQEQQEQQQHQEEMEQQEHDVDVATDEQHENATEQQQEHQDAEDGTDTAEPTETTSTAQPVSSTTGEVFFNLEDLMQQPEQK